MIKQILIQTDDDDVVVIPGRAGMTLKNLQDALAALTILSNLPDLSKASWLREVDRLAAKYGLISGWTSPQEIISYLDCYEPVHRDETWQTDRDHLIYLAKRLTIDG